jgi:hypothetical protein
MHRLATTAAVLLLLAAPALASAAGVVADAQVQALGGDQYVLRLRSSEAQAFDVLPGSPARVIRVRLYHTTLGLPAGTDTAAFGVVTLTEEPAGHVLVRIDLADTHYRVKVGQGGSASVVEIRISR